MADKRKPTSTSSFGVSRRESHDASAFYARFTVPETSSDKTVEVNPSHVLDRIYCADARHMTEVADNSVALVVTSPPYFAGKEYEEALGEGHVPGDYVDYLEMLHDVFAECVRVLEPGGRIAVNVANLGRKPYRSLAADIVAILQDRLKLLLRGEIVWQKAHGAGGSCAWGSFRSPANPVLRDVTERIVVASKGRFDRALTRSQRQKEDLPHEASITKDEFMEATIDLWDIPPESATRVGHPAPFPVTLPQRLIELYTYSGDVVLDPFMGSGSTAVAAVRSLRSFVGYDTEPSYVEAATERVRLERLHLVERQEEAGTAISPAFNAGDRKADPMAHAVHEGQRVKEFAHQVIKHCGFHEVEEDRRFANGVEVNFVAVDQKGRRWFFDVSGAFASTRPGLKRTDTLWKSLGKAGVLSAASNIGDYRLILLTTDLPSRGQAGDAALRAARGVLFHDAVMMASPSGQARLSAYARGEGRDVPLGELMTTDDG